MKEEKLNNRISNVVLGTIFVLMSVVFVAELKADEIKFGFKNPSFSGVGGSSLAGLVSSKRKFTGAA